MEFLPFINALGLSASVVAILGSLLSKYLTHKKETKLTIKIGGHDFVVTINNKEDVDRLVDEIQKASPTETKSTTSPSVGVNND